MLLCEESDEKEKMRAGKVELLFPFLKNEKSEGEALAVVPYIYCLPPSDKKDETIIVRFCSGGLLVLQKKDTM